MDKLTIKEIEDILSCDEDLEIEILPNGEVRKKGNSEPLELGGLKPLTMRESLGGEYSLTV